jgi:hypothetical protein
MSPNLLMPERGMPFFHQQARFFSGFQLKINKNPIQSDIDLLRSKLPATQPFFHEQSGNDAAEETRLPVPECFYPG